MIKKIKESLIIAIKIGYKILYYSSLLLSCSKPKLTTDQARQYLNSVHPNQPMIIRANNHINIQFDLMVIIPAYNAEKFIGNCIDSVLMQETSYSYKIIIVNDGSTDKTATVLEMYSSDQRVDVIHQENRGQAGARNRALENIVAKYIMFIDSDDLIPKNSIENLMKKAVEMDADIVEGNIVTFTAKGKITPDIKHNATSKPTSPLELQLRGTPWGKVFRAELFRNIKFPVGNKFEDTIMALIIFPLSDNAYTIKEIVYEYFINPKGISSTIRDTFHMVDTFWITDFLLDEQKYFQIESSQLTYMRFLKQVVVNHGRLAALKDRKIQECVFVLTRQWFENKYMAAEGYFDVHDNFRMLQNALNKNNFYTYNYLLKGFRII